MFHHGSTTDTQTETPTNPPYPERREIVLRPTSRGNCPLRTQISKFQLA
jgi:hypothetical protein